MADAPTTLADGAFKITKVGENVRDWNGQQGSKMKSYRINLEGGGKKFDRVELAQRAETAAPTVGQELNGQVTERSYESGGETKKDLKFKKAPGGGGFGGGGGRRNYPEDDPRVYAAKQASIVRQSSIDRAISFLSARGELTGGGEDTDEALLERVQTVAVRVHGMVNDAAAEAFARRGGRCPICGADHGEKGGSK